MSLDLKAIAKLTTKELSNWKRKDPKGFQEALKTIADAADEDRKATQLAYYHTANPMALPIHLSTAREVAVVGGNRSSKTDTCLAELAIQMTGHIPQSLQGRYPKEKIKAPIRARVVCNSITDTLEPIIKPKLQWTSWNGVGDPTDGKGHWGWIPRHCLRNGNWDNSYSEKYRTLYASVDNYWVGSDGSVNSSRGWSSAQFMSYDQDLSAFAGTSLHFVMHDELPRSDIYRENKIRTMDVKGQIYTAFTPPDEIGMSRGDVSWFFDTVYEPGLPGPVKDPRIDTFQLFTEENTVLDRDEVEGIVKNLSEAEREVRLHGKFIHLSGVIYSLFTTRTAFWCHKCKRKVAIPIHNTCDKCGHDMLDSYIHVIDPHTIPPTWPIVFVIDPHPRKKDAFGWFAITPSDDVIMIAEGEMDGTADDVKKEVFAIEEAMGIRPVRRLMDPNIALETNDKLDRGWNLRRAYDEAGLRCDLATDDINTGIQTVNSLLIPDPGTRRPRFRVFSTCQRFIYGMGHWAWDDWTRGADREPKEKVRDRHKDFPDLIRYLALSQPTFSGLTMRQAASVFHRPGRSIRGY